MRNTCFAKSPLACGGRHHFIIMKITIEPSQDQRNETYPYSKVTIDHPSDDLHISDVVELLSKSLLAWGFHKETVDEALNNDENNFSSVHDNFCYDEAELEDNTSDCGGV